jgi:hypothetical protein
MLDSWCITPNLTEGAIVRVLADDTIAEVTRSSSDRLDIEHRDRVLGRGPWYMHPTKVVAATDDESSAYRARVARTAGGAR